MELALEGKSPFVVKNGVYSQLNLHHSNQNGLGALFELSASTHKTYHGANALHPYLPNAHPITVNRELFNIDRDFYWRSRGHAEQARRSSNCGK